MFVGVLRVVLHLPGNDSLKGKRRIVRGYIDRVRAKFNASVAEVGSNDDHKRAIVGLSVVGNQTSHVHAMLGKIASFTTSAVGAEILDISTETIPVDDHLEPFLLSPRDEDRCDISSEILFMTTDEEKEPW
jgi:uncharacterized protein YlxP (DUF503 family)